MKLKIVRRIKLCYWQAYTAHRKIAQYYLYYMMSDIFSYMQGWWNPWNNIKIHCSPSLAPCQTKTYTTAGLQLLLNEVLLKPRAASGTGVSWAKYRHDRPLSDMEEEEEDGLGVKDKLLEVRISIQLEVYTRGCDGKQLHQFPLIP